MDNSEMTVAMQKILIPLIRKVMPDLVAAEILGVQPMGISEVGRMEIGETYLNDADSYSQPGDPVEYYWAKPLAATFSMRYNGIQKAADEIIARNAEMIGWANETFGDDKNIWIFLNGKFCFTNEADRMLFVLRWK